MYCRNSIVKGNTAMLREFSDLYSRPSLSEQCKPVPELHCLLPLEQSSVQAKTIPDLASMPDGRVRERESESETDRESIVFCLGTVFRSSENHAWPRTNAGCTFQSS